MQARELIARDRPERARARVPQELGDFAQQHRLARGQAQLIAGLQLPERDGLHHFGVGQAEAPRVGHTDRVVARDV
jgi:hypothetical protein